MAMPHRGRLNLLADILGYPSSALFHKIKGGSEVPEGLGVEGDVLSHLCEFLFTKRYETYICSSHFYKARLRGSVWPYQSYPPS